jgi:methylmalonyl-CoA mutase, N-terminal domain
MDLHRIDAESVQRQIDRVRAYREQRDQAAVDHALRQVAAVAEANDNLLVVMKEALLTGATIGDICGCLRGVWGEYRPRV